MLVFKVVLIGITGVVFANYFKSVKGEYSMLLGLFVAVLLFYYIVVKLKSLLGVMDELDMFFGGNAGFVDILVKMLGISYICELSSGICKDAGYQSIATQIIIFGKITIMALGSSILFSLIKMINVYLG